MSDSPKSVLVIGASGRLGKAVLHQLANNASKPKVHAFCRDLSKLSPEDRKACTSVYRGNARSQSDIENALDKTKADFVVISVGNADNLGKTDIRTASAQALATAMQQPQYSHVRSVVVSSHGAGDSRIIAGFGIGKLIEYHIRHILKDHNNQEAAFESVKDRTDIVRPTALTDNKATGKVQVFGNKDKCPNFPTFDCDRQDVAMWIAEDMMNGYSFGGKVVNIATKK